jgi:hypothetical protein
VLLVGGYDGSGNYGDVLQLATAIETVRRLPDSPLPVAVVELETQAHHAFLERRHHAYLEEAAFVHYSDGEPSADRLVKLAPGAAPPRSVLYLYGGGYLNHRWGDRKVAHVAAVERLAGGAPLQVAASGLQLDEPMVVPGGAGHDLLSRASWVGVRDVDSLKHARSQVAGLRTDRIELVGDDAVPFLRSESPPSAAAGAVNLHVNDGVWVSGDPGKTMQRIIAFLCELGRSAGMPLDLQPVIAYEDPRVSERRLVSELLEEHGDRLREGGLFATDQLDVLEDATDRGLTRFRRARLTVSCSYHVTLTSLLSGIPAVLIAENDYYRQKAAGLRDLFDLKPGLLGVRGTPADAAAAVEVLVDGASRDAFIDHLHTRSRQVVARYERGRVALMAALVDGLRSSPAPAGARGDTGG